MKKLLLGSAALTLFSISILIFQISCKKDAKAQSGTNSCSEIIIVNFPSGFNPLNSTSFDNENGIVLESSASPNNNTENYTYFLSNYSFRDIGSLKQKTYTFKTNIPGSYTYSASVRKSISPMDFLQTYASINLVGGHTYNITINASDFH